MTQWQHYVTLSVSVAFQYFLNDINLSTNHTIGNAVEMVIITTMCVSAYKGEHYLFLTYTIQNTVYST